MTVNEAKLIFQRLFDEEKVVACSQRTSFPISEIKRKYPEINVDSLINLSSISSLLINEVGRWCERYASDFLINWNSVCKSIKLAVTTDLEKPYRDIILFGIRRSGVDDSSFVMCNMENKANITNHYSRIYAVNISTEYDSDICTLNIELKDIQSGISAESYRMDYRHKTKSTNR